MSWGRAGEEKQCLHKRCWRALLGSARDAKSRSPATARGSLARVFPLLSGDEPGPAGVVGAERSCGWGSLRLSLARSFLAVSAWQVLPSHSFLPWLLSALRCTLSSQPPPTCSWTVWLGRGGRDVSSGVPRKPLFAVDGWTSLRPKPSSLTLQGPAAQGLSIHLGRAGPGSIHPCLPPLTEEKGSEAQPQLHHWDLVSSWEGRPVDLPDRPVGVESCAAELSYCPLPVEMLGSRKILASHVQLFEAIGCVRPIP